MIEAVGFDRDVDIAFARLRGIDDEVDQYLLNLGRVGHDGGEAFRKLEVECCLGACGGLQQVLNFQHLGGEIPRLDLELSLSRKRENLCSEVRRHLRPLDDLTQVSLYVITGRQLAARRSCIAQDARQ